MACATDISEYSIVSKVYYYLHTEVRVSKLDYILKRLQKDIPPILAKMNTSGRGFDLKEFLESQPNTFYTFELLKTQYVALARNLFYVNARIAKQIASTTDKEREEVLQRLYISKRESFKGMQAIADKFHEYEFAKSALVIRELLLAIGDVSETGSVLTFEVILRKVRNASILAKKALTTFEENASLEEQLRMFIKCFHFTFNMRNDVISVNHVGLASLIRTFEIDLLWSYAGVCCCKGMTSIEILTNELNAIMTDLSIQMPALTNEYVTEKMLRCRLDMFFLPGDGTVWLRDTHSTKISEFYQDEIESFFHDYLSSGPDEKLNYKDSLKCLLVNKKELVRKVPDVCHITIASSLYGQFSRFTFENGFIMLSNKRTIINKYMHMVPVEVPSRVILEPRRTGPENTYQFTGIVEDVGLISALLKVVDCYNTGRASSESLIGALAFSHTEITTLYDGGIESFSSFLQLGSKVVFKGRFSRTISMNLPYQLAVLEISNFSTPFVQQVTFVPGIETVMAATKMTTNELALSALRNVPQFLFKTFDTRKPSQDGKGFFDDPTRSVESINTRVPVFGLHLKFPDLFYDKKPPPYVPKQAKSAQKYDRYALQCTKFPECPKRHEVRQSTIKPKSGDQLYRMLPEFEPVHGGDGTENPPYIAQKAPDTTMTLQFNPKAALPAKQDSSASPDEDLKQMTDTILRLSQELSRQAMSTMQQTSVDNKADLRYRLLLTEALHEANQDVGINISRNEMYRLLFDPDCEIPVLSSTPSNVQEDTKDKDESSKKAERAADASKDCVAEDPKSVGDKVEKGRLKSPKKKKKKGKRK